MSATPTPRTDAEIPNGYRFSDDIGSRRYINADFARQLETELAEMTKERDYWHDKWIEKNAECFKYADDWDKAEAERDRLRDAIGNLVVQWRKEADHYKRQVDEARSKDLPCDQMISAVTFLRQCAAELEESK